MQSSRCFTGLNLLQGSWRSPRGVISRPSFPKPTSLGFGHICPKSEGSRVLGCGASLAREALAVREPRRRPPSARAGGGVTPPGSQRRTGERGREAATFPEQELAWGCDGDRGGDRGRGDGRITGSCPQAQDASTSAGGQSSREGGRHPGGAARLRGAPGLRVGPALACREEARRNIPTLGGAGGRRGGGGKSRLGRERVRRLPCLAGLLLGAVLLAAVRRLPLRKPRGPGRSRAKLAEVSGGARSVPAPPAREGGQPGPGPDVPEQPALARCPRPAGAPTPGEKFTCGRSGVRSHPGAARLPLLSSRRVPAAAWP